MIGARRLYLFEHAKALCGRGTGGDVLATLLHQVHYWSGIPGGRTQDGVKWTYHTYEDWQKQFPWWGHDKIFRAIKILEDLKLIFSDKLTACNWRTKKWYRVNYDHDLIKEFPFSDLQNISNPVYRKSVNSTLKTGKQYPENQETVSRKPVNNTTQNTAENTSENTNTDSRSVEVRSKESKQTSENNQSVNIEVWLRDQSEDKIEYIEKWVEGQIKKREGTRSQVRNSRAFRTKLIGEVRKGAAQEFYYTCQEEAMKILKNQGGKYADMTDEQLRAEL